MSTHGAARTRAVIDAGGKLLLPGFNDAHVHFVDGGAQLDSVQLNDATSPQEFARRIGEQAKKARQRANGCSAAIGTKPSGRPPNLPTKELIDSAHSGHSGLRHPLRRPLIAGQFGGLRLAGDHCADSRSSGRRHRPRRAGQSHRRAERCGQDLVFKVIPPLTHDQRVRVVKRALAHAASLGVTSVQHMNPDYADIAVYSELLERGELTTRIYAAPLIHAGGRSGEDRHPPRFRRSLSAHRRPQGLRRRLARLRAPRISSSHSQPHPTITACSRTNMHPLSLMRDRMMKADAAGLQICTHAIGDQGISIILDLYCRHRESARRGRSPLPHRARAAHGGQRFRPLRAVARDRLRAALSRDRRRTLGREPHRT